MKDKKLLKLKLKPKSKTKAANPAKTVSGKSYKKKTEPVKDTPKIVSTKRTLQLLLENKHTDQEIIKQVNIIVRYELTAERVPKLRLQLNRDQFKNWGFPAPVERCVEIKN